MMWDVMVFVDGQFCCFDVYVVIQLYCVGVYDFYVYFGVELCGDVEC